ncbi:Hypothetical protein SMAX5B_016449 [Scophthalmus maximus]|uniref:Uncharacterized protein n=1 Tax=Scophthalmus maximus TaxID=52904 RepID=A0A2U9BDW2_SCOMX|nr:Hypothetical protein SMAX5B_016449 [Scophthalmus maximus]
MPRDGVRGGEPDEASQEPASTLGSQISAALTGAAEDGEDGQRPPAGPDEDELTIGRRVKRLLHFINTHDMLPEMVINLTTRGYI